MRVLLVGFGSVGRAFASLLASRRDSLYGQMGMSPRLVGVIDSRGAAVSQDGLDVPALLRAKNSRGTVGEVECYGIGRVDPLRLIAETAADVLVEASPSVLGDPLPAFNNLKAGLSSRKHVISVNKAPLALAMPALLELAEFNRVQFRYSGTVGAGTPVLATARTLGQGDRIKSIQAILNGTTNFILWTMQTGGGTYAAALAEAVRLGYAETDPSADVDGFDTATKVVILANAILGRRATTNDVRVEGIRAFPNARIAAAAERGNAVKLVGEINAANASAALSVSPQEVPLNSPMNVPANLNAVRFTLEAAGEVTMVGRGAGGPETATAILRDLVDIWHDSGTHP